MRRSHQMIRILCSLGVMAALAACSTARAPYVPELYRVGSVDFDLAKANVLQTWPVIQYETPFRFARVALQMPPHALKAGLPSAGAIQIDILNPEADGRPDRLIAANFLDWAGRETAPGGTRYHYDPKSKLQADGGKTIYLRGPSLAGLETLEPAPPRGRAPVFFLHRDGGEIDGVIDCREDVPPSQNVGEYCSLRRQEGSAYGYRILFPRSLLPHWAEIDRAAADYLKSARASAFFDCIACVWMG